MKDEHYRELSKLLGIKLSNTNRKMDTYGFQLQDDVFAKIIDMARVRNIKVEQQFQETGHLEGGWMKLKYIYDGITEYKKIRKLYDFTDMIIEFNKKHIDTLPQFDVVIIDEAQDLSWLQWQMVKRLAERTKKLYIAGDDDQAIFKWAGARPEFLINMEGILARNKYNLDKLEEDLKLEGYYYQRNGSTSVNAKIVRAIYAWEKIRKGGELTLKEVKDFYYYLLVDKSVNRGHKTMQKADKEKLYNYETLTTEHGLNASSQFPWFDALDDIPRIKSTYIRAVLRRNQKINHEPRIKLSTIHGAKGGEADNVMLLTDLSKKTDESYWFNKDEERRVFYVGMTRAKQSLNVIRSKSNREFTEVF